MDNNIKKNIEDIQRGSTKKGAYNFNDIHVFTMPKGFKKSSNQKGSEDADSAKKTGFIILIIGFLLLLLILFTAYYFFVHKPKNVKVTKSNNISAELENVEVKKEVELVKKPKTQEPKAIPDNIVNEEQSSLIEKPGEALVKQTDISSTTDNEKLLENAGGGKVLEQPIFPALVDIDKDGLSLEEEIAVGTSDNLPDTDGDTYNDLAEMLSGYNPIGEGTIENNPNFGKIDNSKYSFSFYYPKSFQIKENTGEVTIIDLGNEEFFQLFVDSNEEGLSLENWYKKQFGVNVVEKSLFFIDGEWNGIRKDDQSSIVFKNNKNNYVIVFNYSRAEGNKYLNVFEIVSKTFKQSE